MCSLLSKFSLSNGFWNWWRIWMTSSYCIWKNARTLIINIVRIKKLCGHHHLLLLIILRSSWSFPLINKIKQMGLISINTILVCNSTCGPNSIISNITGYCRWAHCTLLFYSISTNYWNDFILILCLNSIKNCVSRITLSQLCHKISIEHCLSHLNLILILV